MYRVLFEESVAENIRDAYEWYKSKQVGLRNAFLNSITGSVKLMEKNPTYYSFIYGNKRRIITKQFPYKIIFEIFGNEIFVSGVFHFKQNSK